MQKVTNERLTVCGLFYTKSLQRRSCFRIVFAISNNQVHNQKQIRWISLVPTGLVLASSLIIGSPMQTQAASLTPGDLALVSINTDNPDSLKFLTLADTAEGTTIQFTNNGWQFLNCVLPKVKFLAFQMTPRERKQTHHLHRLGTGSKHW